MTAASAGDDSAALLLELHGCIVDYACRHRHLDVIYEVCRRHPNERLSVLNVPHARLASACLYKIVGSNNVSDYPTALQLVELLFTTLGSFSNNRLVRCYTKLLCGLKIKILFETLKSSPREAFCLLRKYFSRDGDSFHRQLADHNPTQATEMKRVIQDFRKSFLLLIGLERRRETFMRTQYERFYGQHFTQCLTQRTAVFLTELEKDLPDTFLDELLKANAEAPLPTCTPTLSDVMTELLLDSVEGKTTLQSADLLTLLNNITSHLSSTEEDCQHISIHDCIMSSFESSSIIGENRVVQSSCNAARDPGHENTSKSAGDASWHSNEDMDISCETSSSDDVDLFLTNYSKRSKNQRKKLHSKESRLASRLSRKGKQSILHGQQNSALHSDCHVPLFHYKEYHDSSGNQYTLFS